MGGRTFPDLHVPRLSPALYAALCAKYLDLLSTYYTHVFIPPPAPGKTSHGDVDFLVFGPLGVPSWSKQEIASALGAARTAKGGPDEWNFAVPIPDDLAEEEEAYVQLDVEQVESVERLKWMTFKKSYGDLWQILGVLLRPMGLVGGDEGLSLSVREIEEGLGPRSMRRILLSRSVEEVLGFLGLDRVKFAEGFGSETELFEWLISTPLFHKSAFTKDAAIETKNDRRASRKRPMFCRFRDEFLPTVDIPESHVTRESVLEKAFSQYGIQPEYDLRLMEYGKHEGATALKRRLVVELTRSKRDVATCIMALKRFISVDEHGQPVVLSLEEAAVRRDSSARWSEISWKQHDIVAWFEERLDDVLELETERQRQKANC